MKSKEFVGAAEKIKSHELSIKSMIESLRTTLSGLHREKNSIQSEIYSLQAELSAAMNDTDEDGEPNYGRIAAIQAELEDANDSLETTEDDITETSGELKKAEQEYEKVEEEKAQTLFEIQQRARKTADNIAVTNDMYGAYADVAASLARSFQSSYDALAQAAGILGGAVDSVPGGRGGSVGKGNSNGSSSGVIGSASIAISGSGAIAASSLSASGFKSTQISGSRAKNGSYIRRLNGQTSVMAMGGMKSSQHETAVGMHTTVKSDSRVQARFVTTQRSVSDKNTTLRPYAPSGSEEKQIKVSNQQKLKSAHASGTAKMRMVVNNKRNFIERHSIQRAARQDLEHYRNNSSQYDFEDYSSSPKQVFVDPKSIFGMNKGDDKSFWTYKGGEHGKKDYIRLANAISQVRILHEQKGIPYKDIAKLDGIVGACATYYFLENAITVEKIGNAYYFQGVGRHRLEAAIKAGIDEIPVSIIGEQKLKEKHASENSDHESHRAFLKKFKEDYPLFFEQVERAKSHSDLINLVKNNGIARDADFAGMDVDSVKEMVTALWNAKQAFPFLDLPYVGSIQNSVVRIKNEMEKEFYLQYQKAYPGKSSAELRDLAKESAKGYMEYFFADDPDSFAMSISVYTEGEFDITKEKFPERSGVTEEIGHRVVARKYEGIYFNEKKLSEENVQGPELQNGNNSKSPLLLLKEKLNALELRGESPKGCASMQYLMYHEMAHQADAVLRICDDPEVQQKFRDFSQADMNAQKTVLCTYAGTTISDYVAEAYAESMTSENPRQEALWIKQKFDAAVLAYKKKRMGGDEYIQEKVR